MQCSQRSGTRRCARAFGQRALALPRVAGATAARPEALPVGAPAGNSADAALHYRDFIVTATSADAEATSRWGRRRPGVDTLAAGGWRAAAAHCEARSGRARDTDNVQLHPVRTVKRETL